MKRFLFACTALAGAAFGSVADAAVIPLTLSNPGATIYQQTNNNPCVIGDSSCNNPTGFGYTLLPSGGGSQTYDAFSPTYTRTQLTNIVGTGTFIVGFDINSTTKPIATETLDLFTMLVNGVVVASYDPASPGTQLTIPNNGNGFSDALILGFSTVGLLSTDLISFHAIINNATDGREEFFLINGDPVKAPEPLSIAVLGVGLAGLGITRRRRQGGASAA